MRIVTFYVVAAMTVLMGCTSAPYQDHARTPLRVLFVGNSYTYYNNLPEILEVLSATRSSGPSIEAAMVVEGGATLADWAEDQRLLQEIGRGDWDVVVLQEQSTFGNVYLVNGQFRVDDPSDFCRGASTLVGEVRAAGARPLLFHHWKQRDLPSRDHRKIAFVFMHIGRELDVEIAPVGLAWEDVRATPGLGDHLYADDGSHPAPAGSYLAAAVLYEVITGRSPVGLPAEARGPSADSSGEGVASDSTVELVRLTAEEARTLQVAAHSAVERLRSAGGHLDVQDPGPPDIPQIPRGSAVDLPELRGVWTGPLAVYPSPATLVLRISRGTPAWTLKAEVQFGGRPDDILIDVKDVSITSEGIRFVDPNGPNGGQVRYQGVWLNGTLTGIAEIIVPGEPIYGIGTWTLARGSAGN